AKSGRAFLGLTVSPPAFTVRPTASMFFAALISRSWRTPQIGQVHWRTSKVNALLMYPHPWHRCELGYQRSILTNMRPYQSALYSSCRTNSAHPTSLMLFASVGWRAMFLTAKDSTQITWFSRIRRVVSLCSPSRRWSAILAWMRATFRRALSRFLEPSFYGRGYAEHAQVCARCGAGA